jgi:hypothetical protein
MLENSPCRPDFRYVNWGATKEQVKRTEAATAPSYKENENLITYETTFQDRPATLTFHFVHGQLAGGMYHFRAAGDNWATYCRAKGFFVLLFGPPTESTEPWTEQLEGDTSEKNSAMRSGGLAPFTRWDTSRSRVEVWVSRSETNGLYHVIRYLRRIIAEN